MPKAYILNDHLNANDRRIIEEAINGAGCTPINGAPANVSTLDPNVDVGVVGLPVAFEDEETVNVRMQAFAGCGIRIVCIWLHNEDGIGVGVPEGVGNYGMTVDIGSPDLSGVLQGDMDTWEEPGGALRPVPLTRRNRC